MKRLLTILLGFLIFVSCYAEDRYASRMTPDGTIFFVMPKKLGKLRGIKHFDYDMTLLSWTDSVTINFTFKSKFMGVPDNLAIQSGNECFNCKDYGLLFQDIKKNLYEIRITSKFAVKDLNFIINNDIPPIFLFNQNGNEESATYREGAWKKECKILKDIYNIYEYSKLK